MRLPLLLVLILATSCLLPSEPSQRIEFRLGFQQPRRIPIAGEVQPSVEIVIGGQPVAGLDYRLESLTPGIVRVDSTGRKLIGVSRGTSLVRIVYVSGIGTRDTTFSVHVVVHRVAIRTGATGGNATTINRLADTTRLRAVAFSAPTHASDTAFGDPVPVSFTWTSREPHVATVSSDGLVTAVDDGTAVVVGEVDGVEGHAIVTVRQTASVVLVSPNVDTLFTAGRTTQFSALVLDSAGRVIRTARPHWSSTDVAVAQVDRDGRATASRSGTARLVARVGDAADTAILVVNQVVRHLFVLPPVHELTAIDDTSRAVAYAKDSNDVSIDSPSITWASKTPSVVTVNQSGLIAAKQNGEAVIIASSGGASAFAVAIVRQEIARLELLPTEISLTGKDDTVRLQARAFDRNGHAVTVGSSTLVWRSAPSWVARVDSTGLVKASSDGSAQVTVSVAGASSGPNASANVIVTGVGQHGRRIAFESARGIEVVDPDGSNRTLLITTSMVRSAVGADWYVGVGQPAWSPDGGRITFVAWNKDYFLCEIFIADADGANIRRFKDHHEWGTITSCDERPTWSPDGERIAFSTYVADACSYDPASYHCRSIWVMTADGSELVWNFGWSFDYSNGWPTWSPDGTKLAFERTRTCCDDYEIWIITADGKDPTRIAGGSRSYYFQPAWSPDGSQIALQDEGRIDVIKADGSGETTLTPSLNHATAPAWSPDGTQIVFSAFSDNEHRLYIVNRDGTGLRQLVADGRMPAWR